MHKMTFVVGIFALLVSTAAVQALDGSSLHDNPPSALLVEHAELLLADDAKGGAKGFLTIWNGTDGEMRLTAIASESFQSVSTLSSQPIGSNSAARRTEEFVPIPAHAELRMQPNGIRILLGEPAFDIRKNKTERLTLTFDDGTTLEVIADIVNASSQLIKHHHGQADVDPG